MAFQQFRIHGIIGTIAAGTDNTVLTAGVDYVLQVAEASRVFCRIVSTRNSAIGDTTGGGTEGPETTTATIDQSNRLVSVTVQRPANTAEDTRFVVLIYEYFGVPGGADEFIVRDTGIITISPAGDVADSAPIAGIANVADVVPWVCGVDCDSVTAGDTNAICVTTDMAVSGGDVVRAERGAGWGPVDGDTTRVSYAAVEFTGSNWNIRREALAHPTVANGENYAVAAYDSTRSFFHYQYRVSQAHPGLDDSGGAVAMVDNTTVSIDVTTVNGNTEKFFVLWLIESLNPTAEVNEHFTAFLAAGTGGEEQIFDWPLSNPPNAEALVGNASLEGGSCNSTGGGTAFPRGNVANGLRPDPGVGTDFVASTWQSDNGQSQDFSAQVFIWPKAPIEVFSSGSYDGGFGSFTEPFTIGAPAGTARALIYIHSAEGGNAGVGATNVEFDGVAMTLLQRVEGVRFGQHTDLSFWVLYEDDLPAAVGSYDVTGDSPTEYHHQGHFILLTGADDAAVVDLAQTVQEVASTTQSTTTNNVLAVGSLQIDAITNWNTDPTPDGSQTELEQTENATYFLVSSFKYPPGVGPSNMIEDYASNNLSVHGSLVFQPVAGTPIFEDLDCNFDGSTVFDVDAAIDTTFSVQLEGSATFAAELDVLINLAADFDGSAVFVASLSRLVLMGAQFDGSTVFDVDAAIDTTFAAAFNGAATLVAELDAGSEIDFLAVFNGSSTLAVEAAIDTTFGAEFDGLTVFSADLTGEIDLAAQFDGSTSVTFALGKFVPIGCEFDGVATFTAELQRIIDLDADFEGQSTFTASSLVDRGLATNFDGSGSWAVEANIDTTFGVQFDGVSTLTAELDSGNDVDFMCVFLGFGSFSPPLAVDTVFGAEFNGQTVGPLLIARIDRGLAAEFDGSTVFDGGLEVERDLSALFDGSTSFEAALAGGSTDLSANFDGVASYRANLQTGLRLVGPRVELTSEVYDSLYFNTELPID